MNQHEKGWFTHDWSMKIGGYLWNSMKNSWYFMGILGIKKQDMQGCCCFLAWKWGNGTLTPCKWWLSNGFRNRYHIFRQALILPRSNWCSTPQKSGNFNHQRRIRPRNLDSVELNPKQIIGFRWFKPCLSHILKGNCESPLPCHSRQLWGRSASDQPWIGD